MKKLFFALAAVMLLCSSARAGWFGFLWGFNTRVELWEDLTPSLSWPANSYDYGTRDVGSITNAFFTITNSGNDTAEDVATTVTGVGFRLYSTATFGNISSGRTRIAKVEFQPTGVGSFSGYANYSAPNIARRQIALTGTGAGASDTTPDQFTFTDQTNVALSSTITSTAIPVAGINSAAPITVTGGTYDINASGTFTASAGTVNSGDTVRARHTSSGSNSTATDTVVTIGGVNDTFRSTTIASGTAYKTDLNDYWDLTASLTGVNGKVLTNTGAVMSPTDGAILTTDMLYNTGGITTESGAMTVLVRFKRNTLADAGRLTLFKRNYTGFVATASSDGILIGTGTGSNLSDAAWGASGDATKGRKITTNDINWHLVCLAVSSGTAKTISSLYFDGTAQTSTTTYTIGSGDAASNLFILGGKLVSGVPSGPSPTNSTVSHVAIWNRALTAEECAAVTTGENYLYGGW